MAHKNYAQTHCPLTGKICAKLKILKITELHKKNSINFSLCQDCLPTWVEKHSKNGVTPLVKPKKLSSLPAAIKELADIIFGSSPKLPKITVSHDLVITPKLLQDAAIRVAENKSDIVCPGCGTTLEEMTQQDRLSCPECYEAFSKYLKSILMNFHGSLKHKGKIPKHFEEHQIKKLFPAEDGIKFKIAALYDEKRVAIAEENYERAGEIKKEIEKLQNKLSEDSSSQIDPLTQ